MTEVNMATQGALETRAQRLTSFKASDFTVPKGREEEWRFTPVVLFSSLFSPQSFDFNPLEIQYLPAPGIELEHKQNESRENIVGKPSDILAASAFESAVQAEVITVEPQTIVNESQMITLSGNSNEKPQSNQLVFKIGAGAQVNFVLTHKGLVNYTQGIEIEVGVGAKVTFVSIQDWDEESIHASNHRISLGKDAQIKHALITLGGKATRISTDVQFGDARGDADLLGLYFTEHGQHQEHRLFVAHEQPACKSRVTYKGALHGEQAHAVWVGDVLIGREAFDTDTYEMNRNLVLGKGPRVDSVPNLEIENGEILGAGHASATGRFDDEQLFYLCSRGISPQEAKKLVVRGFFAELINQIELPEITKHVMDGVERRLQMEGQ